MITTERLRFRAAGMDGMGVSLSSAQRLYTAEEVLYIGPRKIRRELGVLQVAAPQNSQHWPREAVVARAFRRGGEFYGTLTALVPYAPNE